MLLSNTHGYNVKNHDIRRSNKNNMTYKEIEDYLDKIPVRMVNKSKDNPDKVSCSIHGLIIKFDRSLNYAEVLIKTELGEVEGATMAVSITGRIPLDNIKDFNHLEKIIVECNEFEL